MSISKRVSYLISGWRLPVLNLCAAIITCTVIVARRDWMLTSVVIVRLLDIIARVSVVFFLLAFVARPLNELLHVRVTRWLVKNRRYLGLSFSAWFLQHLWLLPSLGVIIFERFWLTGKLIFPAITLLLVCVLTVTSFNRAQRSMPGWKLIHWFGVQALWLWFLAIYLKFYGRTGQVYQLIYICLFIGGQALRSFVYVRRLVSARAKAHDSVQANTRERQSA